jgi:hypothetical protein
MRQVQVRQSLAEAAMLQWALLLRHQHKGVVVRLLRQLLSKHVVAEVAVVRICQRPLMNPEGCVPHALNQTRRAAKLNAQLLKRTRPLQLPMPPLVLKMKPEKSNTKR